jgi:hypothetical protein
MSFVVVWPYLTYHAHTRGRKGIGFVYNCNSNVAFIYINHVHRIQRQPWGQKMTKWQITNLGSQSVANNDWIFSIRKVHATVDLVYTVSVIQLHDRYNLNLWHPVNIMHAWRTNHVTIFNIHVTQSLYLTRIGKPYQPLNVPAQGIN